MEIKELNFVRHIVFDIDEHWRGFQDAAVTLIEYGDYQCPQCRVANEVVKELLRQLQSDEFKFIFRHFPLTQIHPRAGRAAEAAEAAGEQDSFWEMHDLLFERQERLSDADLVEYAAELQLDVPQFLRALSERRYAGKVHENVRHGTANKVCGTPTFFINEKIFETACSLEVLRQAILLGWK